MSSGAALLYVWPPTLADELRLAVEADVGEDGFSRVSRVEADDPVLLLAGDALVVWHGPGRHYCLPYECIEVGRERLRNRWTIALPAPPDSQCSDQGRCPPSTAAHAPIRIEEEFGQRALELKEQATRLASRVSLHPQDVSPALVSAASTPSQERALGPARAVESTPRAPDTPTNRSPRAGRAVPEPAIAEIGVVVSLLAPIGYVRIDSRNVLVPATTSGPEVPIGARVSLAQSNDHHYAVVTVQAQLAGGPIE